MTPLATTPADLYITGELARRQAPPVDFLREKQAIQDLASRMIEQLHDTVEGHFRGTLSHFWNAGGLVVQILIPLERLAY